MFWWAARNSNPAPRVKSPVLQTVKAYSPEKALGRNVKGSATVIGDDRDGV
jgi:hypothetical protein